MFTSYYAGEDGRKANWPAKTEKCEHRQRNLQSKYTEKSVKPPFDQKLINVCLKHWNLLF
jgi:hypothetical protein